MEGPWGHSSLWLGKVGGATHDTPALEEYVLGVGEEFGLDLWPGSLCDIQAERSPPELNVYLDQEKRLKAEIWGSWAQRWCLKLWVRTTLAR